MTGIKNLISRQVIEGYASLLLSGHFKALTVPPLKKGPQPSVELNGGQIRDSLRTPLFLVECDHFVFVSVLKYYRRHCTV